MEIFAQITGIKYRPSMCKPLEIFETVNSAFLADKTTFILKFGKNDRIAVSRWVTPKRTRSYPYARVYDTLGFSGKKVTIIPITKDEGKQGDRDFLQWDTISLMSLLGIYTIITYYDSAEKNPKYSHKITAQKLNLEHMKNEIERLKSYQSDALHWNIAQIEQIGKIGKKALEAYKSISAKLNVEMHSCRGAEKRIELLLREKTEFMEYSRAQSKKAQVRESMTIQPKEQIQGMKGTITIQNYLGGNYHLTCDEVEIHSNQLYLIEAKHSKRAKLPSYSDLKDGLIKMILFTNLTNLGVGKNRYSPVSILKLTTAVNLDEFPLRPAQIRIISELRQEAETNGFRVKINEKFIT